MIPGKKKIDISARALTFLDPQILPCPLAYLRVRSQDSAFAEVLSSSFLTLTRYILVPHFSPGFNRSQKEELGSDGPRFAILKVLDYDP